MGRMSNAEKMKRPSKLEAFGAVLYLLAEGINGAEVETVVTRPDDEATFRLMVPRWTILTDSAIEKLDKLKEYALSYEMTQNSVFTIHSYAVKNDPHDRV